MADHMGELIFVHESHGVDVRSRLQHVIHGWLDTTDGVPGTLVVLKFLLQPLRADRRIKSATMTIRFADENGILARAHDSPPQQCRFAQ